MIPEWYPFFSGLTSTIVCPTCAITIFSCSASAVCVTTSHNTPISILSTVKLDNSTNKYQARSIKGIGEPFITSVKTVMSSRRVPPMNKAYIAEPIFAKYSQSAQYLVPTQSLYCIAKISPNTYRKMINSDSVLATEVVARAIPGRGGRKELKGIRFSC